MKKVNALKGVYNALKVVVKYAAYITLVIEVVEFALSKLEAITPEIKEDSK